MSEKSKANGAERVVLDVTDDVRLLVPIDLKTGKPMDGVEIPVRYIGMAERGEIGRRHQIVGEKMQTTLDTVPYYAEIVRKGIVCNDKYAWEGIVDKDGNPVSCTDDAKDRLPDFIADQVIDYALVNIQKEAFSAAVREALSEEKEASSDAENPTSS